MLDAKLVQRLMIADPIEQDSTISCVLAMDIEARVDNLHAAVKVHRPVISLAALTEHLQGRVRSMQVTGT